MNHAEAKCLWQGVCCILCGALSTLGLTNSYRYLIRLNLLGHRHINQVNHQLMENTFTFVNCWAVRLTSPCPTAPWNAKVIMKAVNHVLYRMTGKTLKYFIPESPLRIGEDLMSAELRPADDMPMLRAVSASTLRAHITMLRFLIICIHKCNEALSCR